MQVTARKTIDTKAWLSEFMLLRSHFQGATGRPLYSYLVEYEEFKKLKLLLNTNIKDATHATRSKHWAVLYCLFIAERFRREYGEKSGEWSWDWAEKPLNCQFTQQQRAEFVESGLGYWKRPIRKTGKGRNFLGSLFLEGGLPWPLIKSETHGFGRVIRKGLKDYHDNKARLGSTSDLIAFSEKYLPRTFRNLDTRQLLAGVIEQLMFLAERYPTLKQENDAVGFLDSQDTNWRREFPLPLDETNAQAIINDWLRDASIRHAERKIVSPDTNHFDCEHFLLGNVHENWQINTRLQLPNSYLFKVDQNQFTSTRVEVVFYEGKQMVARSGVLYGTLDSKGFNVRFPQQNIELIRSSLEEPVSMVLLDNGHPVYQQFFANSAFSLLDSPLVFESEGEGKRLLADASCHIEASKVLLRLPKGTECKLTSTVVHCTTEESGTQWFQVKEDIIIAINDDLFHIRLNSGSVEKPFDLVGKVLEFDSTPNTVYVGWPEVVSPRNKNRGVEKQCLDEIINGQDLKNKHSKAGLFNYSLKNKLGETLLRRRFGVLPAGFDVQLFTGDDHTPAQVIVLGGHEVNVQLFAPSIRIHRESSHEEIRYSLHPDQNEPPSVLFLEVKDSSCLKAVRLCLPFPYQGARLWDADNRIVHSNNLMVDHLLGMRVALFSNEDHQRFYLQLKLVDQSGADISRDYHFIKPENKQLSINLFTYQNDLRQMLGTVDDQDAYIELTVETPQRHLMRLNIKRFNGYIKRDGIDSYAVYDIAIDHVVTKAKVAAMLLSNPNQAAISLEELETQGVGTGRFVVKPTMKNSSPWLLYPEMDSAIKFRPQLYIPALASNESETFKIPHSLHEAARLFHPESNADVIDEQIAQMAMDLDHSGWQYLDSLRQNYSHLPLSTFESWLSLSRNPATLAVSIFRLEMDEAFSDRIRNELAIIWESISLPNWSDAYKAFSQWLVQSGLPDHYRETMLRNRQSVLQRIVSGFKEMEGYFETGDISKLPSFPPEDILPAWSDQLEASYGNTKWPKELRSELSKWVDQQELPPRVKALSTEGDCGEHDAVIYLPIFMAYVTSGKMALQDISPETPLPVLKFYIRKLSDFDKDSWYNPTHALLTSYLLANNKD